MTASTAACFHVLLLLLLVVVQQEALAQHCPCNPECLAISSCTAGRIVFRADCACCRVCARQIGESCGGIESPCDSQLGLTCNEEDKTCKGQFGLSFENTTSNATTLQWRQGSWATVKFTDEFNDQDTKWDLKEVAAGNSSVRLMGLKPNTTYFVTLEDASNSSEIVPVTTKVVCDSNGTQVEEGESIDDGCEKRCTCSGNGTLTCGPRCLHRPGSLTDPQCTEVPDENDSCCVMYVCAQKKEPGPAPHLIITGRAPSSVSVAWDDFKPPSYERGYVLEYKVAGVEVNWTQLQANNTPMTSLEGLVPNTHYQIRVSIWEDQDSLGSASEVINVNTTDGCVKNNRTYRVDDEWFEGCEARCVCRANSSVECSERCPRPLYRADSFPADPRCSKTPDKDACCVSVRCDRDYVGADSPLCPDPVQTHSDQCVSSCKSHSDCAEAESCCPVACGATVCTNVTSRTANQSDKCLNIICGPNAQCHLQDGEPKCQCNPGTEGNPNDFTQGCQCVLGVEGNSNDNSRGCVTGCIFKNTTYPVGAKFFDGCEYKCLCNSKKEIECEKRCAPLAESLNDPTCHVVPDPEDSCCNITFCASHPFGKGLKNTSKKDKNEFTDSSDVCHYQNKTYKTNDIIAEGCSKMCSCKPGGLVSCQPRCTAPSQPMGSGCIHLPDPNDPCCNVTICNNPLAESDVGRENGTDQMNQSDNLLVEAESSNNSITTETESSSTTLVVTTSTDESVDTEASTTSLSTEASTLTTNIETTTLIAETTTLIAETTTLIAETTTLIAETTSTENKSVNDVEDETTTLSTTEAASMDTTSEMNTEASTTDSSTQIFPIVKDHFNELGDIDSKTVTDTVSTSESSVPSDITQVYTSEEKSGHGSNEMASSTTETSEVFAHAHEESHFNNALAPNTETTTLSSTTVSDDAVNETTMMTSSETTTIEITSSTEESEGTSAVTANVTLDSLEVNATTTPVTSSSIADSENTSTTASDNSDEDTTTNLTHSEEILKVTNTLTNGDVEKAFNKSETNVKLSNTLDNGNLMQHSNASDSEEDVKSMNTTSDVNVASINELNGEALSTSTELITSTNEETTAASTTTVATTTGEESSEVTESSIVDESSTTYAPDDFGNIIKQSTTEKPSFFLGDINVDKKSRMLDTKHSGFNKNEYCEWDSWRLEMGGELEDGCRQICRCLEHRKISCKPITCPYHQHPEMSGCLLWDYDIHFQPIPGNCCAPAICKNKLPVKTGAACDFRGRRFSHLEPIPASLVITCDQECRCFDGNVTCESRCPPTSMLPPSMPGCPAQNVRLVPMPGDECCKEWRCEIDTGEDPHVEDVDSFLAELVPPVGFQTVTPSRPPVQNPFLVTVPREEEEDAIFKIGRAGPKNGFSGFPYIQALPVNPTPELNKAAVCETKEGQRMIGEQWEESPGCRSRRCACILLTNGTASIECTGGCYPLDRYLDRRDGCPVPVVITPDDPCFCPYVMCNKTSSERMIQNLTAVALNSTTVRVRLVIPQLFVGLFGQVEVLYTEDATQTNTSTWNKEVFSHRDDLFAEAAMQHDLHGLVPDTTYYVKANVYVKEMTNKATSSVVTVQTLPLPASSTTTTTLPPQMTVNPHFNVTDQQARSLQISWRPFTPQEKRVIDGVQLKYRVQGDEAWGLTPLIHRDVTSHVLRNLRPNTAYEVDMAVVIPDDATTEIETVPPSVFFTSSVHDDYAFNITLTADKVLTRMAELHWTGVPFPMHKYVNLYAIYYRTDQDVEQRALYKPAKVEQISLEDLKPGSRYNIWMEAYLSNGEIRSSNVLEVMTKPGALSKQPEKEKLEVTPPEGSTAAEASSSNSYYEALIAVAVVAAVCILGFTALLVFLFRRQGSATAPITAHKSQSAYDNPTYKPSYEGDIENGKTPT